MGIYTKALKGGLRMIKTWIACTMLLIVVMKSPFGVKDAYLKLPEPPAKSGRKQKAQEHEEMPPTKKM